MKQAMLICLMAITVFTNAQKKSVIQPYAALDSLDKAILKDIESRDIAGAAYAIFHNGQILRMNAFGEADIASHRKMQTTDIFRLASMTKPITSLALLLLQEDGLINMNDRLEKYLPAFANQEVLEKIDTIEGATVIRTHPAKQPILLRHLLTHTAGFASQYGGKLGDLYTGTFKNMYLNDLADFSNKLSKLPLNHEPGEGWIYGPSINIASRVIEVVSGMPFQEFLKKRIFRPLGMNDTDFYFAQSVVNRLTSHYTRDSIGNILILDPGNEKSKLIAGSKLFYSGSGGLNSTLKDYLSFCTMILNNGIHEGKVIAKAETIAQMKIDQVPLNINADMNTQPGQLTEGFTFGYQIVRKENNRSKKTVGTLSWGGATGPIFFIDQEKKIIAMYLVQMQPYSHIYSRKIFVDTVLRSIK